MLKLNRILYLHPSTLKRLKGMFTENIYTERRNRLQEAVGSGLILLPGNEESPMNYTDNVYPFRQDSNFLYYFGLDQFYLAGLIDLKEQQVYLFGDEADVEQIVWTGPHPSLSEQASRAGIRHTKPYAQLADHLKQATESGRPIHYLPPYRGEAKIELAKLLGTTTEQLAPSEKLIKAVVAQRSVKGPEEIQEMEKALAITRQMHISAMQSARPAVKEAELSGMVEGIALATESQLAYPAILTVNGQTLHNHYHGNTLQQGQLVLGDFGAEAPYTHYASDITRTFPVDKAFTSRQKDIYQIVLDAQMAVVEALKPGEKFLDLHLLAARKITDGLQAIGLMQGDPEEAVQEGAHALFFPHGLGHMIGLDVHDMEGLGENLVGYGDELERSSQFGLKALRLGRSLQTGFVLTVEPGLYFIPELIALWKKQGKHKNFISYDKLEPYLDFSGVRIEDNYLITSEGYRLLGPPIPKTIEEVETIKA